MGPGWPPTWPPTRDSPAPGRRRERRRPGSPALGSTADNTHPEEEQMPPNIEITPPPIKVAVRSFKCIEETDEVGSDEPYIIVVAANLAGSPPGVEATLYGPWNNVDKGELIETIPLP